MSRQAIRIKEHPAQWETLKQAAERTGYSYKTFTNWKHSGRLPFPIYVNNLVKPAEVDAWVESTRIAPCVQGIERVRI